MEVVARIGDNLVQEERMQEEYQTLASIAASHHKYLLRPVEMQRLPSLNEDHDTSLLICIYDSPGPNDLLRFVDCGDIWYHSRPEGDEGDNETEDVGSHPSDRREVMPLHAFLDFAVGAAECIEMLHSQQLVHGQIRADAFHFSQETGRVRLIHLGAGFRAYDTGRLSGGSPVLANQNDAATSISLMSPEQTGQAPIQPDNRADIYSLGVLLWSALVHEVSLGNKTPTDIIREVLGKELPSVSTLRPDVPEIIARVIAKATAKNLLGRYNSVSGLRHDLVKVRKLLAAGDMEEAETWEIASKDVSPFFTLPRTMVGRTTERDAIVEVLNRIFRMYQGGKGPRLLSVPEGQFGMFAVPPPSGDNPGDKESRTVADGFANLPGSTTVTSARIAQSHMANKSRMRFPGDSQHGSSEGSEFGVSLDGKGAEKRLSALSTPSIGSSSGEGSSRSSEDTGKTAALRMMALKGRCEVITIEGGAGLGKTRLITSVQIEARRKGFFASSRFDLATKERQRPVLQLFSSLFEQAFSENTIEPSFLPMLRNHIGSAWDTLHKVLGLPKFLLGSGPEQVPNSAARSTNSLPYRHPPPESTGTESSQEFLRTGSSAKSLPLVRTLLDILRAFTQYKFVCLCLDDVHLADEESLELITQIVSARIRVVLILAYRPENASSEMLKHIHHLSTNKGILPSPPLPKSFFFFFHLSF